MKRILLIGIGAGDPDYITVQAIKALNRVDVFFLLEKGPSKEGLIDLRRLLCERFIIGRSYRFVSADSPEWSREGPDYGAAVDGLNQDKQAIFERLIREEMQDGECAGVLVWGDPSLYDSSIRIMERIAAAGALAIEYEVIPGITSVQALTARHKTTLNRIAKAVEITTGRRLAAAYPEDADSVVVMLDPDFAAKRYTDRDLEIYWGAYVGTVDEILVSGKLRDVADKIDGLRRQAKQDKGWIMDTYLLKRPEK